MRLTNAIIIINFLRFRSVCSSVGLYAFNQIAFISNPTCENISQTFHLFIASLSSSTAVDFLKLIKSLTNKKKEREEKGFFHYHLCHNFFILRFISFLSCDLKLLGVLLNWVGMHFFRRHRRFTNFDRRCRWWWSYQSLL